MNTFTIKDLENLSGIKAHTIRIWEQRYSLIKPSRTDTNIRYYSGEELKKILNVALLNKYGFKISRIDKMCEEEIREKILSLNQTEAQHERIINELITSMVDLRINKFEEILDNYILARGVEKAIPQIIFPFLEKIGILWLTNHINPAQEHLVTNIVRQKIMVGIEAATPYSKINKKIVLFLPDGEYHELGLLFLHYLLKSKGLSVIYLGASTPLNDLQYVVDSLKPDYLYTHITSVNYSFDFEKYINTFFSKIKNTPLVISGLVAKSVSKNPDPRLRLIHSISEVNEFIAAI